MKDKLRQLENQSRKLDPALDERVEMTAIANRYVQSFLDDLPQKKAFVSSPKMGEDLLDHPFTEEGVHLDKLFELFDNEVITPGLNPASGNHLGYVPAGGIYLSALADYLAAATNRYAGIFFSSPGAVRIENMCIRWMCDLIGYTDKSGGNLTSGGSIANLIGLVSARDHSGIKAKRFDKAVIYTSRQVHHCAIKAIKFAGLSDATVRTIEMDEYFRIKPDNLERHILEDQKAGLIPLIIFASAGTTDLGAVDPLEELGKIAERYDLWFHVDAAYGGFFLLTKDGKKAMKGIEKADSVVIDPHKGLFLPYGSGAILVKDVQKLYASQHMSANYLQDTEDEAFEFSPADLSPELSRHFRGLRMWLPLQMIGVRPFRAALEEKLLLARYFHAEIKKIDGMEVGPEPDLSILFFRYVPKTGNTNTFNRKLVKRIHQDGRIFLSSTNIQDTIYLRLAVLSFRTHLNTINLTISILKDLINRLEIAD